MTDMQLAKRLAELRTEFGRMCLAHDCKDCELDPIAKEFGSSTCLPMYIWKKMMAEVCGTLDGCPAAQKEEAAAALLNESPKAKEETRLPKWCKEGQWVLMNNKLYKIVEVNGGPYYPLTIKDIHGKCISAHPRVMCPVKFRPYTYEEAKALIGKVMEWCYGTNINRCTSIINDIEENGIGVEVNGTKQDVLIMNFKATIDGAPFGVPVVDVEALKRWCGMKMTFETALVYLKQGKRIRRAAWPKGGHLQVWGSFGLKHLHISPCTAPFSPTDILAEDWEVVDD